MRILVDAMGGDHAPVSVVNGCVDAINEAENFDVTLIGDSARIQEIIKEREFDRSRLEVVHATEQITNEDIPTKAIKGKKDSSMVVGFRMLKEKKGDVFLSAGNTGALLTGALLILGRIKGVDRPALAPILPTRSGAALLLDGGANTMCKPVNYLQFGIMGSLYMQEVMEVHNPKVGLINVGSEESKGNETIRTAYNLLSNSSINFIGNIEGREIPMGEVSVAVCDGFVGNVVLKLIEGVASLFFGSLKEVYSKTLITKMSALIIKKDMNGLKKRLDYTEYGGAPFLGVNGKVMKSHGSSNVKAIKNAVLKACSYARSTIVEQIKTKFESMEVGDVE